MAGAVCVALAACQGQPVPRQCQEVTPIEVSEQPTDSPTKPRQGSIYRATDKPCELVDHQLLARLFGPDSSNVAPPQYTKNQIATTMACSRIYDQHGANTTVVPIRIQLADPMAIEAQYQGLRDLHKRQAVLTDVPGLGQAAYTYTDKSIGPQLTLYDSNALLTIGAVPLTRSNKPAARTIPVLIQVARNALATLRT